jgi:uncharacterized membrane protein SirB2
VSPLFAPVLVIHIALALALFLPAIALPLLGARELAVSRGLAVVRTRGTAPIGLGLLLSGLALVAIVGIDLLGQSWLVLGIGLYVVALVVAFATRRSLAGRVRWVSYVIAALIGVIGFLMATKPALW